MKTSYEHKQMRGYWLLIFLHLILLSLLSACSDIGRPIPVTPEKAIVTEVAATSPVEIQGGATSAADEILNYSFPVAKKPDERYLIYIHGKLIEDEGVEAVSPEFGPYEYIETLRYFSDAGFNVISEVRSTDTDPDAYANKVASQVNNLIEHGVPAENITVVGFSKGGGITILTSSKLGNPALNFVLLAICGEWINDNSDISLAGRILSLYEESDEFGSTCKTLVERSPEVTEFDEIEFTTGLRHGAFYTADPAWLEPVISWLNGASPD